MKAWTALVALAVAATLTSVAAAGPDTAAKQRVVIDSRIIPEATFLFVPQQSGALKRDSGTVSGNWRDDPGRKVTRNGQNVTIFQADWVFKGRRGTLTIHERNEWVDVGNGDGVAVGTWKVARGTGQYARVTGNGGSGHAGLGSPWYARYEGFLDLRTR